MDITHKLLGLPTYLLLVIMLVFFTLSSMLITYLYLKFIHVKVVDTHNEVTGYAFSVVAGFYALILAFVVFQALDGFNDVQRDADIEGSLARTLYRQIKYYPDSADAVILKQKLMTYVHLVVEEEYPKMENAEKSKKSIEAFADLFEKIVRLDPAQPNIQNRATVMLGHLNELAKYRNLRNLAGDSEIPGIMWVTLLLGWVITMIFAAMIKVDNVRYHFSINGLLGAFSGLIFFLIIILDHPFTGIMKVTPTNYGDIIEIESSHSLKN